jgi:hypothetical protein
MSTMRSQRNIKSSVFKSRHKTSKSAANIRELISEPWNNGHQELSHFLRNDESLDLSPNRSRSLLKGELASKILSSRTMTKRKTEKADSPRVLKKSTSTILLSTALPAIRDNYTIQNQLSNLKSERGLTG